MVSALSGIWGSPLPKPMNRREEAGLELGHPEAEPGASQPFSSYPWPIAGGVCPDLISILLQAQPSSLKSLLVVGDSPPLIPAFRWQKQVDLSSSRPARAT